MPLRLVTEHDGMKEYDDTHRFDVDDSGLMVISDGLGRPVIVLADGEWRSLEIEQPPSDLSVYPEERLKAIDAVVARGDDMRAADFIRQLYDAAVGRG